MPPAFVVALAASAAISQIAAATLPPPPAVLDAIVEDARGRAVDTLGPTDFSVTERDRPLTIDAVRFVRPSDADRDPAAARLFAIFLDEFHVTPGPGADRVRDALIRFVQEDLRPEDLLVVLKPLDSLLDIRVTRDRAAALRAIQSFEPRFGDLTARTPFERTFIAGAPARVETARSQIAASSLDALALHLGQVSPGRKTLIVVSEGFTRPARRRGVLLRGIDSVVLAANRAHVSIYPIEPNASEAVASGRDADARASVRAALRALAEGTAGRTTTPADDVDIGLTRALTDAGGYYVLTLSNPETVRDGRYHPVTVAVRRPGFTVRARSGYWAPSAEETTARTTGAGTAPDGFSLQIARRTSPLIRPWFGMSYDQSGATRVSFVWEPSPRIPGDQTKSSVPARVALSVTTLDGTPVFDGIVSPSNEPAIVQPCRNRSGTGLQTATNRSDEAAADRIPSAAADSCMRFEASFISPARRLLAQIAIHDAAGRLVDRDVRDLVVASTRGPLSIGTPEVLRARTNREYQSLASNPDAPPVASRQFSRSDRLLIRVPVLSTIGAPALTAELVSGLGGTMRQLPVSRGGTAFSEYQIDLPLAGLATGVYNVDITAIAGNASVRDSLAFRVTP